MNKSKIKIRKIENLNKMFIFQKNHIILIMKLNHFNKIHQFNYSNKKIIKKNSSQNQKFYP